MTSYADKENYITDSRSWTNHANYYIWRTCSDRIKGVCGDLGTNNGECTYLLASDEHLSKNVTEVYGFDINPKAVELANYNAAANVKTSKKIAFFEANMTNLPVENEKFDFLNSFHALEHIFPEDLDAVVSEMFRVLKPGGSVVISIPYDRAYPCACHVNFFKEDDLKALFEKHGFCTVECSKDDRWEEKNLLTAIFEKRLEEVIYS